MSSIWTSCATPPTRLEPDYSRRLVDLTIAPSSGDGEPAYPVTVRLERLDPAHEGQEETVKARFVVGCDGARSAVRKSLGLALEGDSANQAWGVMDVLAVTDFPDFRIKSAVQSANEGNLLIIPREGGYLLRLYIELEKLHENERVSSLNITTDHLIAAAQRILHPYTLEVKEVAWWSVYEIGQRLCDKFDDAPEPAQDRFPRVFIAGDACHTHSPKAGQGMNVSMQDGFNLGWKLASVLRGQCSPKILKTYSDERQAIAKELIDFDRKWAKMFSAPPKDPLNAVERRRRSRRVPEILRQAGPLYRGNGNPLCRVDHLGQADLSASCPRPHDRHALSFGPGHPPRRRQAAASGPYREGGRPLAALPLRRRGRPRRAVLAGSRALCEFLAGSDRSPVRRHTPTGADIDSAIDVRAIFQQGHRELAIEAMPSFLLPRKGRYGLCDYEKMFCPDLKSGADIFDMRGIDREGGCMVVVRPDQYVAHVLPLDAHPELGSFFEGFMLRLS